MNESNTEWTKTVSYKDTAVINCWLILKLQHRCIRH